MIEIQMSPELCYTLALLRYIISIVAICFFASCAAAMLYIKDKSAFVGYVIATALWAFGILPMVIWSLTVWYARLAELRGW